MNISIKRFLMILLEIIIIIAL
ncbi:Protein of unknown function [Streptococcus thermophilus]|nr:Protein of unknown function [Streptococcus thermophilus]